jgi:hypothetical protein
MKSKDDKEVKRPDELNAREYLYQHLNDKVLKGGYRKEFRIVKENIPEFAQFKSFRHLLENTTQESLCNIKEMAVREVVELYQREEDLRPASGVVLIMVLWGRLYRVAHGEWFDDGVYWLLEEAQCINTDEPDLIESLMAIVRKKMHGKHFYEIEHGRRRLKEKVVNLEEDEEDITDYLTDENKNEV